MNIFKIKGVNAAVVAFFLVFVVLPNTIVITKSGSAGVVTRLGKVVRETQPGLNLKVPFIEGVQGMNVQVQKEQVDAAAATQDLQNVTSTIAVNYHLDHARVSDIYINLSADYKDRIIDPSIQEAVKAVTARYNAEELLTKRAAVASDIVSLLTAKLVPRGILIDQVSVVNFKFSPEFSTAIEQKQVAQQQAQKAQYDLQRATVDAAANAAQQAALTSEILEQQAIAKWNGVMPNYVAGQGSVFGIPVGK